MSNLIELVKLGNTIQEILLTNGGDLTPEMELKLMHIESQLPNKADGYAYICDDLDKKAEMLAIRANNYAHAAQVLKRHIKNLKERMRIALTLSNEKEIKGHDHRWKLLNAKARVIIQDESKVPDEYIEVTVIRIPKKDLLYDALICGKQIPGVHLEESNYARCFINSKGE